MILWVGKENTQVILSKILKNILNKQNKKLIIIFRHISCHNFMFHFLFASICYISTCLNLDTQIIVVEPNWRSSWPFEFVVRFTSFSSSWKVFILKSIAFFLIFSLLMRKDSKTWHWFSSKKTKENLTIRIEWMNGSRIGRM